MSNITEMLNVFPLLKELSEEEVACAEDHMYEMLVSSGEVVISEGQPGSFMCFIIEGSLEISKKNQAGARVVLDTIARGESFGEMAVLQQTIRSASVTAASDCTLLVLTAKGFNLLLQEHPRVGASLLRSLAILLSKQLRETSSDLADLLKPVDA